MQDDGNEVHVLFTPLHLSTAIRPSGILLRLTHVMLGAWLKIQRFIGLGWTSRDPVPQRWPNGDPQARSSPPEQPESRHCSLPPIIHPPSGKPPGGKQGLGGLDELSHQPTLCLWDSLLWDHTPIPQLTFQKKKKSMYHLVPSTDFHLQTVTDWTTSWMTVFCCFFSASHSLPYWWKGTQISLGFLSVVSETMYCCLLQLLWSKTKLVSSNAQSRSACRYGLIQLLY